jgi:hypothetical protein
MDIQAREEKHMTTEFEVIEKVEVRHAVSNQYLIAPISEVSDDSLFDVTEDGYIQIGYCSDFDRAFSVSSRHIDPKILKKLMDFLNKNSGKKLANLMGYKPLNMNGNGVFDGDNQDNYLGEEIDIGAMLIPNIDGFSLTLSSSKNEKRSGNIKFKFFGINGAGNKTYERSISQIIPFSNISTRLTVHATSKIIRFENKDGDYFYWRSIESLGEVINTHNIRNEYLFVKDGYEQVYALPGRKNPISTTGYKEPRELTTNINENACFSIGCDIKDPSYLSGSLGLSGQIKFVEEFTLDYIIPPNEKYIFNQNDEYFENTWAIKT